MPLEGRLLAGVSVFSTVINPAGRAMQLLLRLHTNPVEDEEDVAVSRDHFWDRSARGQATSCSRALGLFSERHGRNRVRNATARTGVYYRTKDD